MGPFNKLAALLGGQSAQPAQAPMGSGMADQARQIIRIIRPRFIDDDKPSDVPAFVHVRVNGQDGYMRTDQARAQSDVWAEVLEDALAQLQGLEKRYRHLQELSEVWEAVGRVKAKAKAGFRRKGLQPASRTK